MGSMVGILVLALGISAAAEGEAPEQQYKALLKEYNDAFEAYTSALGAAKTPANRQKAVQEKYPRPEKWAAKVLELTEKHPKAPFVEEALIWILTNEHEL